MKDVLIVGGGASGLLVATHLAYRAENSLSVTIAEPRAVLGRGIAYGTSDFGHLLNVPAGRMSAIPSDPLHFQNWANCDQGEFISRRRYGQYLLDTFVTAQRDSQRATFRHERSIITEIAHHEDRFHVTSEYGPLGTFDVVVLATGHGQTNEIKCVRTVRESKRFVSDPWRDLVPEVNGIMASIGTGLTFVDLALSHLRRNPTNRVVGISRTGELPKEHLSIRAAPLSVPEIARLAPGDLRRYIESAEDWRAAQDGVRHELPSIWFNWSDSQKSEFWTEHLRWWNVHRHRMAPDIAAELQRLMTEGRLEIIATDSLELKDNHDFIGIDTGKREVAADIVINSTGYGSIETTELFGSLLSSRLVSRAPLGLGVRSNFPTFELLDEDGNLTPGLFGIGPILLGERFETTAIPEIRDQAVKVADAINAL
jgi:uncharacterized NAD(P)/FAD-binding protein YdhS